jgi:hypothetical protein
MKNKIKKIEDKIIKKSRKLLKLYTKLKVLKELDKDK